jgi:hypothetical protein
VSSRTTTAHTHTHKQAALYIIQIPCIVASHLKILIPVSTAIIRDYYCINYNPMMKRCNPGRNISRTTQILIIGLYHEWNQGSLE